MSWDTTGNAGTSPANDFLGTTDQQPLVLRTNGREDLRINPDGNVGIGTTDPGSKLEIVGDWVDGALGALKLRGDKPSIKFAGGAAAGNELWAIHLGSRGPGNLSFLKQAPGDPPSHFDFPMTLSSRVNPLDPAVEIVGDWNGDEGALRLTGDKPTIKFAGGAVSGNARWALHLGSRGPGNLEFIRETGPGAFDHVFTLSPTNRVGIGTSSPSATLEVAGDFKVTGNVTHMGTLSVALDVILTGADCAEHFNVVQDALCEPGTVMTISKDGSLNFSNKAYDKKVAGVVSGAGAFRPAIVLDSQPSSEGRLPVALFGKVYCKADAQYAPIEVGDLLTTSDTVGHAMKASDSARAFGAVVGKALGNLPDGRGLIPILITLQ